MKKFLALALIGMFTTLSVMAQGDIKFAEAGYKFGKIQQSVPATHEFIFTNASNKPVVIEFATAECGCTTPEYAKEPIMPGKSSKVKVTYNAAATGEFTKRVTVKFAGIAEPTVLTISGEVVAKTK
ncbi:MAG: DUF1573 domain-containing protein [Chitinophagaceae bacterium]|jgi:hypothetical protein|nr:DUF1573 domain-containing protein [Chitinophagaceae bacterium]